MQSLYCLKTLNKNNEPNKQKISWSCSQRKRYYFITRCCAATSAQRRELDCG